ncbi:MAG TPA: hypothetical protein PKN27_12000 [Propionibacteriaceae bacterium]|nr:hypothetical protein [Propionibacteriaceae bacterium]
MTLPPCPIAGHDNPHHFHLLTDEPPKQHSADPGHPMRCDHANETVSRCYSAHVPEPSPDPDEWVRVPVGTRIPAGMLLREEWPSVGFTANEDATVQIRRSDLDAILKPTPTPAEKLAEALTQLVIGAEDAWLPDDVQSALDAAGLTLAERGEK